MENKDIVLSKNETQNNTPFYELIFDELKKIDLNQFYIVYDISDYNISDEVKLALIDNNIITQSEKDKLLNKYIINNFNAQLSLKTQNILKLSESKRSKKTLLKYLFSKPYKVSENKVLIVNSIEYRDQLSNDIKGGTERVIVFKKEKDEWIILQIENFVDY